jgi:hypothetical protein
VQLCGAGDFQLVLDLGAAWSRLPQGQLQREVGQEPRVCPRCKSPYWNKPRKRLKPAGK